MVFYHYNITIHANVQSILNLDKDKISFFVTNFL
jgi:hypothetical protein